MASACAGSAHVGGRPRLGPAGFCSAIGILLAALAVLGVRNSLAATWSPALVIGSRFDQDRGQQQTPRGTLIGILEPQLGLDAGAGPTRLQVYARSLIGLQPEGTLLDAARRTSSYDRISEHAGLRVGRTWSETGGFSFGGHYVRTHDPLESGDWSALAVSDLMQWNGWARGSLWRAEGEYRIDGWSYSTPGLSDARAPSWSASILPIRHRQDAWLVSWRERDLQLESSTSIRSRMATLGYRRLLSPLVRSQIEIGAAETDYLDGTHERAPAVSIVLSAAREDFPAFTPSIHIWRDFATNVTAEAARGLGAGRLSLRWESVTDVEGGIFREPTHVHRLIFGAQDTVARATVFQLEASYGWIQPFHALGPQTQIIQASQWITRRMRPWLLGRSGISYQYQAGSGNESVPLIRRVQWDVALTAHAP